MSDRLARPWSDDDLPISGARVPTGRFTPSRPAVVTQADALVSTDAHMRLMAHALTWLTRLAPATLGLFYPVDRRLRKFTDGPIVVTASGSRLATVSLALRQYALRHHAFDPLAPRHFADDSATVVDLAALGDRNALEQSMFAREYLSALGATRQTTLFLRSDGRIVAGIDLLAGAGDAELGPRELGLLRTSHGLLEHAYVCVQHGVGAEHEIDSSELADLTAREAQVAMLVAAGASNAEVARALYLSQATVKSHLVRVFAKLNVSSRTQLAVLVGHGRSNAETL